MNAFVATLIVLALIVALAWLVRRGPLARLAGGARTLSVETAIALGERRSLVIVTVEGRRLLLGLTPASVSLVTELDSRDAVLNSRDAVLDSPVPAFDAGGQA